MKKGIVTDELLTILINITNKNSEYVSKKCIHLGKNQLLWRPSRSSWNCIEVLSHLLSYSNYYHPIFKKKIEKGAKKQTAEQFISSPLGRSAWKSMKLGRANNIKRKFQATKKYNPSTTPSLVDSDAVSHFIQSQNELTNLLRLSEDVNLKRVKIPMSISKIIRLRLGDAFQFVVYHNERHIQQLKNVIGHPNFPKKKL